MGKGMGTTFSSSAGEGWLLFVSPRALPPVSYLQLLEEKMTFSFLGE